MDSVDCCYTWGGRWFRYRACAVIPNGGRILMVTNPGVDYYYSVGGGVRHGESAEEAVRREVLEETGVPMEIDRLTAMHENFFRGLMDNAGLICHEVALYFLMRPADLSGIRNSGCSMDGQPERLAWIPLADFNRIKVYPAFLPELLESREVRHIVTREE
ncbi:MAG: NUDIX domain-containing protein [Eubacteriales bacterium]|nr:NUDIX domain-containing protein [Eubacteriales bacterium]